jgi:MFS transporter, DHA1 family, inner membrane transport protein
MTTTLSTSIQPRSRVALAVLGLGSFVVGTAELVIVGVLNLIAGDMHVSISTAGLLVTCYALGISLGGPIMAALTIKLSRRMLLWLCLALYVLGNIGVLLAASFGEFAVARVLTGTVHGLFIGVAMTVGAMLVPPEYRGRAISMVFGGISVATVLGVPLGTLVGQSLGWRAAFVGIVVLGVIALVLTLLLVPEVPAVGASKLGEQARNAFAPRVLAMLTVGLLIMGGQFAAFTYLAEYLQQVTKVSGVLVSGFLLIYGVSCAVGTFVGGRLADRRAVATLVVANVVLIVMLLLIFFFGGSPILIAICLVGWGLFGFGLVPSLQLRVISLAGRGGDLASTLGASAVNAGIAVGAAIGGLAVAGYGVRYVFVVALLICLVALPATAASGLLKPPGAAPESSPAPEVDQIPETAKT